MGPQTTAGQKFDFQNGRLPGWSLIRAAGDFYSGRQRHTERILVARRIVVRPLPVAVGQDVLLTIALLIWRARLLGGEMTEGQGRHVKDTAFSHELDRLFIQDIAMLD